jgi:hypothetical protein
MSSMARCEYNSNKFIIQKIESHVLLHVTGNICLMKLSYDDPMYGSAATKPALLSLFSMMSLCRIDSSSETRRTARRIIVLLRRMYERKNHFK